MNPFFKSLLKLYKQIVANIALLSSIKDVCREKGNWSNADTCEQGEGVKDLADLVLAIWYFLIIPVCFADTLSE